MVTLWPTVAAASAASPTFLGPIGAAEETPTLQLGRDDGVAVALPNGQDLWIFGDTPTFKLETKTVKKEVTEYVTVGTGKNKHVEAKEVEETSTVQDVVQTKFVSGSTAAEAPYAPGRVPTSGTYSELKEVKPEKTTSGSDPARFVSKPKDVYLPNGSGQACTATGSQYPARWVTGAAVMPNDTSLVLVTYVDVCVSDGWNFQVEGWGFDEYNWKTNSIALNPVDVFPPARNGSATPMSLWSPVFSGGYLTLFSSNCSSTAYGSCLGGQVYATTIPNNTAALENPRSYSRYPISTDGSGSWTPLGGGSGDSVAAYPGGVLRLVEQTSVAGTFDVFESSSVQGPWHLETTGSLPGCQSAPRGFCYAFVGHPELSTASQLLVSYYDPNYGFSGHLVMASVPL